MYCRFYKNFIKITRIVYRKNKIIFVKKIRLMELYKFKIQNKLSWEKVYLIKIKPKFDLKVN